eukprot:3985612-Prymnesium_polylepis.1
MRQVQSECAFGSGGCPRSEPSTLRSAALPCASQAAVRRQGSERWSIRRTRGPSTSAAHEDPNTGAGAKDLQRASRGGVLPAAGSFSLRRAPFASTTA